MRVRYFCLTDAMESSAGAGIFDRKLIGEISRAAECNVITVNTQREAGLPIWAPALGLEEIEFCRGEKVVVSHESLHALVSIMKVDVFIVHNYFSAFEHSKPYFSALMRLGSSAVYRKIFQQCEKVVFISGREYECARRHFPEFAERFAFSPPGVPQSNGEVPVFAATEASLSKLALEMPGSTDWYFKRRAKKLVVRQLTREKMGYLDGFGADDAVTLIYDDFLSGFKLKLLEALIKGRVILSLCDLRQELEWLGVGDYPGFKVINLQDVAQEVLAAQRYSPDLRTRLDASAPVRRFTWNNLMKATVSL